MLLEEMLEVQYLQDQEGVDHGEGEIILAPAVLAYTVMEETIILEMVVVENHFLFQLHPLDPGRRLVERTVEDLVAVREHIFPPMVSEAPVVVDILEGLELPETKSGVFMQVSEEHLMQFLEQQ